MRIITGKAKSIKLLSLDNRTRPLSDRAKTSLFSLIQSKIENSCILDLYAGSGALGIECLSRNSSFCTFVDVSKKSIESIKINLERSGLKDKAEVIRMDAREYVKTHIYNRFDIVFVCPPYDSVKSDVLEKAALLLNDYGIIIFEHHEKDKFKELNNLKLIDKRTYGIVCFEIYQLTP